jgi:hypothetical protein
MGVIPRTADRPLRVRSIKMAQSMRLYASKSIPVTYSVLVANRV